jgi:hypothetical protein
MIASPRKWDSSVETPVEISGLVEVIRMQGDVSLVANTNLTLLPNKMGKNYPPFFVSVFLGSCVICKDQKAVDIQNSFFVSLGAVKNIVRWIPEM